MNIKKTNKEITKELNRIENRINGKLKSFYNSYIKGSPLPIESLKLKYQKKVRNIIRQTVQESYLYGSKIVTKQVSDISTEFVDFISTTDINKISEVTNKTSEQFWKTAGRLHQREDEFVLLPDGLELKPQFDTTAAMIGLGAYITFLAYNSAVTTKFQSLTTNEFLIGDDLLLETGFTGITGQVMFLTQEDALVDPEICEPFNREVYDIDDPDIPTPPLHNHCRCRLVPLVEGEGEFI